MPLGFIANGHHPVARRQILQWEFDWEALGVFAARFSFYFFGAGNAIAKVFENALAARLCEFWNLRHHGKDSRRRLRDRHDDVNRHLFANYRLFGWLWGGGLCWGRLSR